MAGLSLLWSLVPRKAYRLTRVAREFVAISLLTFAISPHDLAVTDACVDPARSGHIRHYTAPQIAVDRYSNLHVVYSRDLDGVGVGRGLAR